MTNDMATSVKEMVKTDRNLKWQRFDPQDLARIMPELRGEMERHGYEVPTEVAQAIDTRNPGRNLSVTSVG